MWDLRKAILDYAIACEMERDAFFEAAWKQCGSREQLRRGVAYPSHDLAQHLDTSLHKLAGTSLRAERPDLWEN